MSEEEKAIRARRQLWVCVVNDRDRGGYAELFTSDAVWIPPGQAAVRGREAIRRWLGPFFEKYEYDFSISGPRLRVAGDWAVECGTFTSRLTTLETGETASHGGSYLVLWRREADGDWYIERYVDVTDLGRPTAEEPQSAGG